MLNIYMYCTGEKTDRIVEEGLRRMAFSWSGERIVLYHQREGTADRNRETGPPDIVIIDSETGNTVNTLLSIRKRFPDTELAVFGGGQDPPAALVRPDIRLSGYAGYREDPEIVKQLLERMILQVCRKREMSSIGERLKIRSGDEIYFIPWSDILCIEARDKHSLIRHTGGIFTSRNSLKEIEKKLPAYFLRSHRGALVNCLHIRKISMTCSRIDLSDSYTVPVSRACRRSLRILFREQEGLQAK